MFAEKMLIKRNLLIYFRDKGTVFFSVLSSIITLLLYILFINNSLIAGMSESVANLDDLKVFLNVMLLCGVIALNTFTIPLSFMVSFVDDRYNGRLKDFFVSPIKKRNVVIAYVICAVIATLLINLIVIISLVVYLYINDVLAISLADTLLLTAFYLFCSVLFSIISFFIASVIKSPRAHSNMIGVSSALIGFLSGVYMPIGNFDSKVIETVITMFPITHLNALLRQIFGREIISQLFAGAPSDVLSYREFYFGIKLSIFDTDLTVFNSFSYLFILFIIFAYLSTRYLKKSK